MQFTFDEKCGDEFLNVENEVYKYLFKARRHKLGDKIPFRNLKDKKIYIYEVNDIDRRKASLQLLSSEEKIIENNTKLHLGWCMVDPKTVEKSIASLNEMGLDKITFIYCEYSQKNFKQNIEKLEKILINSSSQCGRSSIIKLETCDSLEEFIKENDDSYILDFSTTNVSERKNDIKTIILGCEGGFSESEREMFNSSKVVGFDSNLILRSESAAIAACSKIII